MKDVPLSKILVVIVISTLLFFSGFGMGLLILKNQATKTQNLQEDIKTEILGLEVEQELLLKNPCNLDSLRTLGEKLSNVEQRITILNGKSGASSVQELKKIYAILEIKHWQLVQASVNECNASYVPIFYFYSNVYCADCKSQGYVLSYVKELHPNAMIYSFDSDVGFSLTETLRKVLNAEGPVEQPTIVVGNQTLVGLQDSATLISLMTHVNSNFNSTVA